MSFVKKILAVNNDLPIRTHLPVHSGKVRSVYWLTDSDSKRLIKEKKYDVALNAPLAIMIISDRVSAFDCIWHGEGGLQGVPGKGAALNAISNYWFDRFKENNVAGNHILETPHPLVWIVQKARPVMIEAIARQYMTGSLWRSYKKGNREFCGIPIPDGLQKNQKLPNLLITPSTKGVLKGIPTIPEIDDVNITRKSLEAYYSSFNFNTADDVNDYETLLRKGFSVIANALANLDQILVDTKFEFGYVTRADGQEKLIYMDEVGTPDSSRIWDAAAYRDDRIIENSKENFRQFLLNLFPDPDILLNQKRMAERQALATNNALPEAVLLDLSATYQDIAEKITGKKLITPDNPKHEIVEILGSEYGLIDSSSP